MAQGQSEAQQAAMLMKLLQQQQGKQDDAPKGPTWKVVAEIVNIDTKTSTINADIFGKMVTGTAIVPSSGRYVTNQIDEGADLLFNLEFSEKIKIESITFYCKPHPKPDNGNNDENKNNNDNNNNNNNANANNDANADANTNDNNNDNNNENKENENKEEKEDNNNNNNNLPVCPTRLYFAKNSETLSNYFETKIISRDDSFEDNEFTLYKLNSNKLTNSDGYTISFLKQRPKVYKGTGLRTNSLIFGISHEPNQLDDDDDDDTDIDMDGDEKYKEKSIYLSGIVIKAAGQLASKQDFAAQAKAIEKIKKGDN